VLTWYHIQRIAPTLIIVLLGLGINVKDAYTWMELASGVQFKNRGTITEVDVP
jgi:hypothetical protein